MIRNRRTLGSLLFLAALGSCLAACGKIEDTAGALEASKITMTQAVKTARAKVADCVPLEVELEMIDGKPHFNVEVGTAGAKVTQVVIDGVSGEVIQDSEIIPEPEEKQTIERLLALTPDQRLGLVGALKKAISNTDQGRPMEVDLEDQEGQLVYAIKLMVGNLIQKETVDIQQD